MSYIPASVRLMLMSLPSSRRQRTVNGRVPVALQVRVTELCSRAVTSELLSASSILGGTKEMITRKEKERQFMASLDHIHPTCFECLMQMTCQNVWELKTLDKREEEEEEEE